jgi:MoaA/NifB/PqqE/SkfB family radical SAM enzyme
VCPDKSDKEVRTILKKEAKDHQGIVFTGGEPTVRKELIGWVKYAKELGYRTIQIQTNGRLFAYKSFCEKMIKAGANEFSPALHGSTAKIHDYLTRASGSFDQTTKGIKNLKDLGQYVLTNTVITKPNYKDLPKLAKLLVKLKVNQFQFAFIHINLIIANNPKLIKEIVPKHSEVEPYVKKGLKVGIKAGTKVMTEAIPYCLMKGYEQYIAEEVIPDGSVFDDSLELDDYTYYRKTQGKTKGPNCLNCKYYKTCEGPWKEYPEIFGWGEFKPIIS